jgi:putative transposase
LTVRSYLYDWRDSGLLTTINHLLVMGAPEQAASEASPSAGVIDSRSVKTTDTCGFLVFILVHAADIQDRDGAVDVLKAVRYRFFWLRHVFACGGYAADKLKAALQAHGSWTLEIIKRSDTAKRFRDFPPARGGRTHLRMALPVPRQRLGTIRRKLSRLSNHRQHPHAHPQNRKTFNSLNNF